jgi:hypothetical protein
MSAVRGTTIDTGGRVYRALGHDGRWLLAEERTPTGAYPVALAWRDGRWLALDRAVFARERAFWTAWADGAGEA